MKILALLLIAVPAWGDPLPLLPTATSMTLARRPPSRTRTAAQLLSVAALGLVAAGTASFGVALGRYHDLDIGCSQNNTCAAPDVALGSTAQTVGWGLVSAGVATGVVTLIIALIDGRQAP